MLTGLGCLIHLVMRVRIGKLRTDHSNIDHARSRSMTAGHSAPRLLGLCRNRILCKPSLHGRGPRVSTSPTVFSTARHGDLYATIDTSSACCWRTEDQSDVLSGFQPDSIQSGFKIYAATRHPVRACLYVIQPRILRNRNLGLSGTGIGIPWLSHTACFWLNRCGPSGYGSARS